jgi:glycosyltransferase involved in cell wall biosynthesis
VTDAGRASDAPTSVVVVMRTRDRPLFLERALASVAGQTFADFELVVVNDGGDPRQVEELVAGRPLPEPARARVVHHAEPAGLFSPPNGPIRESLSTFVAVHDDDDSWHPSFLAQTTARLEATGAKGVVATTDRVVERVDGAQIVALERRRLHPGLRFLNLYAMCFENFATPISFLYRREAYEEVGGYDESLGTVADWDFAIRFLARFDIDVLATDEALACYHHRPGAGAGARELNSVYTDRHLEAGNALANSYLRADLAAGRAGLGLAMNALRRDYEAGESLLARQKAEADGQIEYLAACIAKVEQRLADLEAALTPAERLKSYVAFARSAPGWLIRRPGRQ